MIIISHRGYWKKVEEKNTKIAFDRSFKLGFGTETDVRDLNERLVISHDPANNKSVSFEEFIKIYKKYNNNPWLALNIKSDGIRDLLKKDLEKHKITNYFVFDMSLPEQLGYNRQGFNTFTRESEYEKNPLLYKEAYGVWIDMFKSDWITEKTIKKHINNGKIVAIVSPDLHKREHTKFWLKLKKMKIISSDKIILCTDNPEEAKRFFYDKN